jgi:hypothetical protein
VRAGRFFYTLIGKLQNVTMVSKQTGAIEEELPMTREDTASLWQHCLAILSEGWADDSLSAEEWLNKNPDGQNLRFLLLKDKVPVAHWPAYCSALRWLVTELIKLYEDNIRELQNDGAKARPVVQTAIEEHYTQAKHGAPVTAGRMIETLTALMESLDHTQTPP